MNKRSAGIKTVLIIIQNFFDYLMCLWCVMGDYCKPLIPNSKFTFDIFCQIWYGMMKVVVLSGIYIINIWVYCKLVFTLEQRMYKKKHILRRQE
jgi:hypothetical protein